MNIIRKILEKNVIYIVYIVGTRVPYRYKLLKEGAAKMEGGGVQQLLQLIKSKVSYFHGFFVDCKHLPVKFK